MESQLRTSALVVKEIVKRDAGTVDQLTERLRQLGWDIVDTSLTPRAKSLRELFFGRGQEHDAYVEIRGILNSAQTSLYIVDPYVDGSLLILLSSITVSSLKVDILTSKLPSDFSLECSKFMGQHKSICLTVRKTKDFHDRFVIVDSNRCFHIGASIKDAGRKAFMISLIEDAANAAAVIEQQKTSWEAGIPM